MYCEEHVQDRGKVARPHTAPPQYITVLMLWTLSNGGTFRAIYWGS